MAIPKTGPNSILVGDAHRFDGSGRPTSYTRVHFKLGIHGPFTIDFPKGQDSPQEINQAIEAKRQQLAAIQGEFAE